SLHDALPIFASDLPLLPLAWSSVPVTCPQPDRHAILHPPTLPQLGSQSRPLHRRAEAHPACFPCIQRPQLRFFANYFSVALLPRGDIEAIADLSPFAAPWSCGYTHGQLLLPNVVR